MLFRVYMNLTSICWFRCGGQFSVYHGFLYTATWPIGQKHACLALEISFIKWYLYPAVWRKFIPLIVRRTQQPFEFHGLKLIVCNLMTFKCHRRKCNMVDVLKANCSCSNLFFFFFQISVSPHRLVVLFNTP